MARDASKAERRLDCAVGGRRRLVFEAGLEAPTIEEVGPMRIADLQQVVAEIEDARRSTPARRAVLAAVTGIDGSGKGYVAARIAPALHARGWRVAAIPVDGWLNLPRRRFDATNPGPHFYAHAIRFEAMFSELVLPLRDRRSIRLVAQQAEETAREFRERLYEFDDVDVVLLEGIFLLKRELRAHYDRSFWIDCTFETALERAIARAQEGLPPGETAAAYRRIYFPAQETHLARDDPRGAATATIRNDPRLGSAW